MEKIEVKKWLSVIGALHIDFTYHKQVFLARFCPAVKIALLQKKVAHKCHIQIISSMKFQFISANMLIQIIGSQKCTTDMIFDEVSTDCCKAWKFMSVL